MVRTIHPLVIQAGRLETLRRLVSRACGALEGPGAGADAMAAAATGAAVGAGAAAAGAVAVVAPVVTAAAGAGWMPLGLTP